MNVMSTPAALAALLALSGCMGDNLGLESVHQPVVANGAATVPSCPDWSAQGKDSAASTDSNYGCATNGNLAAMIADPADLIHGKRRRCRCRTGQPRHPRVARDAAERKGGLEKVSSKGSDK